MDKVHAKGRKKEPWGTKRKRDEDDKVSTSLIQSPHVPLQKTRSHNDGGFIFVRKSSVMLKASYRNPGLHSEIILGFAETRYGIIL